MSSTTSKRTMQTGLRTQDRMFEDVDLFRGGIKLDNGRLSQYNFFQTGYSKFFWVQMPLFLELSNKDLCTQFKNYTEKGFTSFDGIQDLTAATSDVTGGVAGQTVKIMTGLKDDFDSFTIKVYEQYGSPVRTALSAWLTGIKDHTSGYCHYNGQAETIEGGFDPRNHTGEIIYVVTDPTGLSKGIEYACYICNIVPTKVPMSHLNFSSGDHDIPEIDLEFTGAKYESIYINEVAKKILEKHKLIENYLDFKPLNDIRI